MKNKFLSLGIAMLAVSGIALASGPMHYFDDVAIDSDAWYADSVYSMLYEGVFAANSDFRPTDLVTRAEMAVMLDRLHEAIAYPKGSPEYGDWEVYENDYYSVAYPTKYMLGLRDGDAGDFEWYAEYSDYLYEDGCGSGLSGTGDYTWAIDCVNLEDTEDMMSAAEAFAEEYFVDEGGNYWIEDETSNGGPQTYRLFAVETDGTWRERVFIQLNEYAYLRVGWTFKPNDADFERYWRSIVLK